MALIVDASVALKWLFEEDGTDRARRLLPEGLVAPQFLFLDCANALAKRVRDRRLTLSEADETWDVLQQMPVRLLPETPSLIDQARRLASTTKRSAYDCLYLVLAAAQGVPLVTADRKFFDALTDHPRYGSLVRLL